MTNLPKELTKVLDSLISIGANPILVGGCVRDYFLKIPIKDYDIEVFEISSFEILSLHLEQFGSVKLVGKSFGVLKLHTKNFEFDFALPRTEQKIGLGHKGFEVETNPNLSFKRASLRRDFTINSIGYEYKTKTFLDPNSGIKDLKDKKLRHILDESFVEDPLRVYRAVQFCARFGLSLEENTKELCKSMKESLKELPKERIFEEFKKMLLKSAKPSLGFELLKELELLEFFPELKALVGCEQEYEYHPEGDVWIHTLMVMDEMAKLKVEDEYKNLVLMFACLCHDLGKPFCTKVINGKITSYKHETLGVEPTISFLSRLTNEKRLIEDVIPLVKYHLLPFQFFAQNSSDKAIKRLATKVNIEDLCIVALADCLGRDIEDKCKCSDASSWLLQKAKELEVSSRALKPFIQGRDLIELGFKPSKEFKDILEFAYSLQLDENMKKEEILDKISKNYILN